MERFFEGIIFRSKNKNSESPGALPGSGLLQTILYPLDNAQCLGFDLCLGASGGGNGRMSFRMSFWGSGVEVDVVIRYIYVYRCI